MEEFLKMKSYSKHKVLQRHMLVILLSGLINTMTLEQLEKELAIISKKERSVSADFCYLPLN